MPAHALVTGAASGIGRAAAVKLTEHGYDVTATDNRPDAFGELPVARALALDVADREQVMTTVANLPPVDLLVNCAGVGLHGPIEYSTAGEVQRIFEINYCGPLWTMQAVLPSMRAAGRGVIVNVTSVAGRAPTIMTGIYSSLKMALDVISETLSYELTGSGIRIIVIEPGAIQTGFGQRRHVLSDTPGYEDLWQAWDSYVRRSLGDHGSPPETVARAILDALTDPEPRLRYAGSPDASASMAARAAADETEWRTRIAGLYGLR
jgi:NAD(P)-dependent dehydrogenase (short-subunit alcohol dehydrogenase family)